MSCYDRSCPNKTESVPLLETDATMFDVIKVYVTCQCHEIKYYSIGRDIYYNSNQCIECHTGKNNSMVNQNKSQKCEHCHKFMRRLNQSKLKC